jgi:CubicO group peptidase (beta-lactamase class C family)
MARLLLTVTLLLIVLADPSPAVAELAFSEQDLEQRLDALLAPWIQLGAPGMAVLVQSAGRDVYRRCLGLADLELDVLITPETCFDFASVSKHLTAFGVLLLAEEGKLSLDDSVRQYVPELPVCAERVKVRHLIHQSSGLWEFWTILNKYSGFHRRDYIRMRDVLTLLAGQPALSFEPGSRYAYTNTNYSLLSLVVERAGGAPFDAWMREHVFAPLGMTSTLFQTDCARLIPHKATAYLQGNDGYRLARPSNVEVPGSAHAFTNLEDMSRWLANLRDRRLGGERIFEQLTTPGVLNDGSRTSYAAGLIVRERNGTKTISHSGQTGGYKTMLVYCPEKELGIVVLANMRSINANEIADEILDVCLGVGEENEPGTTTEAETHDEPESFSVTANVLERYAGGYRLQNSGELIGVYGDRQWLVIALKGLGGDYFSARSNVEFADYSGRAIITFELNDAGEVAALSLAMDGEVQRARRIDAALDAATFLRQAGGHFHCAALGSLCEIAAAEGRLVLKHRRYDTIALHSVGPDEFFCDWGFIRFDRNESGAVTGFKLTDELFAWQKLPFVRIGK